MPDTQRTKESVTQRRPRAESYCKYHCSVCKGHFSSLSAFDAHRRGEFEANDRHCVDLDEYAIEKPKAAKSWIYRNGACELAKHGTRLEDVLVWGEASSQPKGIFNA